MNVLVIEDDVYLSEALQELIVLDGHHCKVATSAAQYDLLRNLIDKDFDRIILDLMMVRSGSFLTATQTEYETGDLIYQDIRKLSPTKRVLVITAKRPDSFVIKYESEKYTKVIQKPLTEDLFDEIINWIEAV